MKKILSIITLFILSITLFSCKDKNNDVNIYIPDGTPLLTLSNILDEGFIYDGKKLNINIVPAAQITSYVSQENADLAIMPTVAAATLYKSNIDIKLLTNNVFGNLYITSTKPCEINDLLGSIVYTTTSTTLKMLQMVLNYYNLAFELSNEIISNKVAISIKNDGSEIIPLLKKDSLDNKLSFAILGEPQVSLASSKIDNLNIFLDIQEEYKKIYNIEFYPQASLIGKTNFIKNNLNFIKELYNKLNENINYINNNCLKLTDLFKKASFNLGNMTFNLDTINRCNINIKKAYLNKEENNTYLNNMINYIPDDNFYFDF